ncbi:MAG: DUF1398 family protein [Gammaproteobacteria bacterium]|nr:DUF1398 family protein [Gammaproteobacteria bacterium]
MTSPLLDTAQDCAWKSYAGEISFGDVVSALASAGAESYHVDYRGKTTTYYGNDGQVVSLALKAPDIDIPRDFDKAGIQSAIRGAQRGEVKYPEFLRLSMNAGCVGYTVWITGRHVTYFGRQGEEHVERFPS